MKISRAVLSSLLSVGVLVGSTACTSSTSAPSALSASPVSRQADVAAAGAAVMPFSLDATLHTFTQTPGGGVMSVAVRPGEDPSNVALIRSHLQSEAAKFVMGTFDDPISVHGASMPGVAALRKGATKMSIVYSKVSDGAQITFTTSDAGLVTAVHEWFDAQVADHGDDAMAGMESMAVADEFEFLTRMIPHHEEAIATATLIQQRSARSEMVALADGIIEAQTREIADMKAWLEAWYPGKPTAASYTPMMRPLEGLSGDALDEQFLTDMVAHHGMAVMMAMSMLNGPDGTHDEVLTLSRSIRDSQRAEIMTMAGWLQDWFDVDVMSTMMGAMHGSGMDDMSGRTGTMHGSGSNGMSGMHATGTTRP